MRHRLAYRTIAKLLSFQYERMSGQMASVAQAVQAKRQGASRKAQSPHGSRMPTMQCLLVSENITHKLR